MEAEMVPSLSPLLQGADEWREVLLLLPLLVALEAVLSADNAIALAAISRRLHDPARQRQALNLGLLLALVLRMALILAARWVLDAWPLQLAAAAYLLWLCGRHLLGLDDEAGQQEAGQAPVPGSSLAISGPVAGSGVARTSEDDRVAQARPSAVPSVAPDDQPNDGTRHRHGGPSLASIALTLALTDLAFSLDSVAAAVAVTDRLVLVMAGGLLGVLALRLTAGLFVRWLELFSRLETAGYLAVGLVGIRLLLRLLLPDLEVPEWVLLLLVTALFLWGFSHRVAAADPSADGVVEEAAAAAAAGPEAAAPLEANAPACAPASSSADAASLLPSRGSPPDRPLP